MNDDEKLERIFSILREPNAGEPARTDLAAKWPGIVERARAEADARTRRARSDGDLDVASHSVLEQLAGALGLDESQRAKSAAIAERYRDRLEHLRASTPPVEVAAVRAEVSALLTAEQRAKFLELCSELDQRRARSR